MEDKKQAYLIMAHRDDLCFRTLLKMLDDPRNDIFIHMDIKNKRYNPDEIKRSASHSRIVHTKRTSVAWGGYSQINAELILLKAAANTASYSHYHLLSGQDLPIKSRDEIYRFFTDNEDKEFVNFQSEEFLFCGRVRYFYPFSELAGRAGNLFVKFDELLLPLQKAVGVARNKNINFAKGANWFSITDSLARHVIHSEPWIRKVFKRTKNCDEVFLQTIVINSPFRSKLYYSKFDDNHISIVRYIDWERGEPYIFRRDDFGELISSPMMFARKFDSNVDSDIIRALMEHFA